MSTFTIDEKNDCITVTSDDGVVDLVRKEKFESFNEEILGLGKIETESVQVNALSVLFDLEGFTDFCKQIDPQLAIPEFLSEFLKWLFAEVRKELVNKTYSEGYSTFSDLPFLSKFTGDGVLFLWNVEKLDATEIINIVISMHEICNSYKNKFYKKIIKQVSSPPSQLRCGIARGAIYSVGNGNDFVGPCINMSTRLQKLNSVSFCFSRRGLSPETIDWFNEIIITRRTSIKGIGDNELVCLLKSEYAKLSKEDKAKFFEV
jgi:hypothetical protein